MITRPRAFLLEKLGKWSLVFFMNAIKYLLTFLLAASVSSALYAQKKDPVEIYNSGNSIVNTNKFKDPVSSDSSMEWRRSDIVLNGIENPDKTDTSGRGANWIKDVVVDLTVVYVKPGANGDKAKWDPKNWIVLKSKADLVAIEKGKKTIVTFFMPPEIKDSYRLEDSQRLFFIIDLSVAGNKIALNAKNFKKFISASLSKRIKNIKQFEKVKQDLAEASTANEGWLMTLPQAPFHVQYDEYYGANKTKYVKSYNIPTYKKDSAAK